MLFTDVARIDLNRNRKDHGLPVRMLLIGLPLTVVTGTFFAAWEGDNGRTHLSFNDLLALAERQALRVSELVDLKWNQVDFTRAQMHVNRLKNGSSATHPIEGDELRLLRRLQRVNPDTPFLFITERGGPLTRSTVSKRVSRAGQTAAIPFPVHPRKTKATATAGFSVRRYRFCCNLTTSEL